MSSLNTFAASAWFIANGAVSWPQTLVMMAGCLFGGFCGAHLARRVPQESMRVVVIAVGALLTAVFAWRYWFSGHRFASSTIRFVIALSGSAIGSQMVKWFIPGIAS